MICRANQWTGFYMITASVMKELIWKGKDKTRTILFQQNISNTKAKLCFAIFELTRFRSLSIPLKTSSFLIILKGTKREHRPEMG